MQWSDALRRAARTFLQSFLGVFLSLMVTPNLADQVPQYGALKTAALAAGWAGVIAVLTAIQNALEDNTAFPAILKAPPSAGQNPAPDPGPAPAPAGNAA